MAFLHLVKVVCRCFWGQMPNLNPVQWSGNLVGLFERIARPTRCPSFRVLSIMKVKIQYGEKRKSSKTTKNHQKWITNRVSKAPFLALYTNICKVIKRFRTAVWTGLRQWQLVPNFLRPPFWDLLMLQLLRPNSSNLPCLYSTFHLEYPLVLSRFYFVSFFHHTKSVYKVGRHTDQDVLLSCQKISASRKSKEGWLLTF